MDDKINAYFVILIEASGEKFLWAVYFVCVCGGNSAL